MGALDIEVFLRGDEHEAIFWSKTAHSLLEERRNQFGPTASVNKLNVMLLPFALREPSYCNVRGIPANKVVGAVGAEKKVCMDYLNVAQRLKGLRTSSVSHAVA